MFEKFPAKKVEGTDSRILAAKGKDFVSQPVDRLALSYGGIEGDFHAGVTRKSGGREPWYPRGTDMRNERQLSIVSEEELFEIADGMAIDVLEPGWIGANLVLKDIPDLSYLPPRTILFFEGGVTLRIDGYNAPCRLAGGMVAKYVGVDAIDGDYSRTEMALSFTKAAEMKRGLVVWVEKKGSIQSGESVTARIWPQWIY